MKLNELLDSFEIYKTNEEEKELSQARRYGSTCKFK